MDTGYTNAEMSRDIMAHIVTNALAPAPQGETPLEQRIRLLQESLAAQNERMRLQRAAIDQMRRELQDYADLVKRAASRSAEAEAAAVSVAPPPMPAPVSAAAAVPFSARLAEAPSVPRPAYAFARMMPYAAMAAVVVVVSLIVSQRTARATLSQTPVPPPAATTAAMSEEAANTEILSMVYAYVPPGGTRSVQDVLRPEIETAHDSPWTIVRVDERTTLVSFRPYGEALETVPVYEFMVDPVAKTVTASGETVVNLRGNLLARR